MCDLCLVEGTAALSHVHYYCLSFNDFCLLSIHFINWFFKDSRYGNPLGTAIPSTPLLATYSAVFVITALSEVSCVHKWWKYASCRIKDVCSQQLVLKPDIPILYVIANQMVNVFSLLCPLLCAH